MNDNYTKLSTSTKVIYGLGDLASQLIWTFIGSYLSIFYTDIVGLTPVVVSTIFLIARLWDGVNDPMFGAIAERTRTKFGRFRPYILAGAPFLALFNVLCFTYIPFENQTVVVIWCLVTYILLGMLYTVINLSYGSLSMVMTFDAKERTELNSWRMIGTNLGAVLLNIVTMPLLLKFSGVGDGQTYNATGFFYVAVVFSLVALPMFFLVFAKCKEQIQPRNTQKVTLRSSFANVFKNKPLLAIFVMMLLFMTGFFGRMGVASYYYIYVLGRFDLIPLLMMLPSLCAATAIFITKGFADRVGKKRMLRIGFIGSGVTLVAIHFIDPHNVPLLVALTALYGCSTFSTPLLMASVPDAIDYFDLETGVRSDGTSYAVVSLATKFGSAIGVSVAMLIMGYFGYEANAEQSVEAIQGISYAVNIFPAIVSFLALIPLHFYSLDKEKIAEIQVKLIERNKEM